MHLYYPTVEVFTSRAYSGDRAGALCVEPSQLAAGPAGDRLGGAAAGAFLCQGDPVRGAIVGAVLHAVGMVPAYRGSDDRSQVRRNLEPSAPAPSSSSRARQWDLSEGKSHDLNRVEMIRTGAARLALQAAAGGATVVIIRSD